MTSFRPKDGDSGEGPGPGRTRERDFHGEKRSSETHESATDTAARLYRKGRGQESRLCFMGHGLMENRNDLVFGGGVTVASGTAEREAALDMIDTHRPMDAKGGKRRKTKIDGDKGFDVADLVEEFRKREVTPYTAAQDHLIRFHRLFRYYSRQAEVMGCVQL